jgi:hypothetical protein
MIMHTRPGVRRRRFIQQSAIVAGGAALVDAMGLSSDANAILGNDHPSNAGLAHLDPSMEHWRKEYCRRASSLLKKVIFPAFRCSATTQRLGKTSGVTATLKCRWK